jgi:hypothetical protein
MLVLEALPLQMFIFACLLVCWNESLVIPGVDVRMVKVALLFFIVALLVSDSE